MASPANYVSMYLSIYVCVRHSVNAPAFYFIEQFKFTFAPRESEQAYYKPTTTSEQLSVLLMQQRAKKRYYCQRQELRAAETKNNRGYNNKRTAVALAERTTTS